MPGEADIALKAISIVPNIISKGQDGVSYTSDQITYPSDLAAVPDDAYPKIGSVAGIGKFGSLYHGDSIEFNLHGEFRPYDQLIEDDPNSVVTPIMANVYVDLYSSEKAGSSELEIHFTALKTPYGTAKDPRIRFLCEGHYDPAGTGDLRFRAVVEIDQNANVNVVEGPQITGGEGEVHDYSPNGFSVSAPDGGVIP
jgi:hypothetical protein